MCGICPKCEKLVREASLDHVVLQQFGEPDRAGISYKCPSCLTVLGVEADPFSVTMETIRKIADEVEKRIVKWR